MATVVSLDVVQLPGGGFAARSIPRLARGAVSSGEATNGELHQVQGHDRAPTDNGTRYGSGACLRPIAQNGKGVICAQSGYHSGGKLERDRINARFGHTSLSSL